MKVPIERGVDSEQKYTARCFGAALILQMILHLVRWAVLGALGMGILAFYKHDAGHPVAMLVQGVAKIILTVAVYAFPLKLYLRMTERRLSDIVRP